MLKILFQILKTLPAFQRLLSEHFDTERAELQTQIDGYERTARLHAGLIETWAQRAEKQQAEAERYRQRTVELLNEAIARDAEIARLRDATTQKLQAVDALPNADVLRAEL